jgi:hypothetical protein
MNYDPNITIAEIPLRYQVVTPTPKPRAQSPDPQFMLHLITNHLLPSLTKFPEAHAAYTATLHSLCQQYGIPQPDEG